MQKPLVIARENFAAGLYELIERSELPACVLADILGITLTQIRSSAQQEYETALREYQQALAEEAKENAPKEPEEEPAD